MARLLKDMKKLNFNIGTEFQKLVWKEIAKIPDGKVISYQDLAFKINRPKSVRAVASACGKNPFLPEVPCHRVVRKDGGLGGYSANGGTNKKKEMLENEGHKFNKDKIILKICR